MIAMLESDDLAEDVGYPVRGLARQIPTSPRAALAAKRAASGRQRLANEARHSRRRADSFCRSSRQRPRKRMEPVFA